MTLFTGAGPTRIQLSRRKGFNLQATSLAYNGLPAVKVDRTTRYGNMFVVSTKVKAGTSTGGGRRYTCVPTVEDAVECFEAIFAEEGETADALRAMLPDLRGKNIACWCGHGDPCHGDVWLRLANR